MSRTRKYYAQMIRVPQSAILDAGGEALRHCQLIRPFVGVAYYMLSRGNRPQYRFIHMNQEFFAHHQDIETLEPAILHDITRRP